MKKLFIMAALAAILPSVGRADPLQCGGLSYITKITLHNQNENDVNSWSIEVYYPETNSVVVYPSDPGYSINLDKAAGVAANWIAAVAHASTSPVLIFDNRRNCSSFSQISLTKPDF
jgi:hypothetical protein